MKNNILFSSLFLLLFLFNSSCVRDDISSEEPMVLNISGSIGKYKTRVAGNDFENNDSIGVFMLNQGAEVSSERLYDNILYVNNSDGKFIANSPVYYPFDNTNVDLYAYYPYNINGIDDGDSRLSVKVSGRQDISANYSRSDFLFSKLENVSPTSENVDLNFSHKLFKLNVMLSFDEGVNIDEVLESNPELLIKNVPTRAYYNIAEDRFADFTEIKTIIPHGEWQKSGSFIVGKSVILLPQGNLYTDSYLNINIAEKEYILDFDGELSLISGKEQNLKLKINTKENKVEASVETQIGEWERLEDKVSEVNPSSKFVDISSLDFSITNVYGVFSKDKQLGIVCKEFICNTNNKEESFVAVVYYPFTDENKPNHSKGTVIRKLNQAGDVHFGTIDWSTETSYVYSEGNSKSYDRLCIDKQGNVVYRPSNIDKLQSVFSKPIIISQGDSPKVDYPLVKIATRYWLRNDLNYTKVLYKLDTNKATSKPSYLLHNSKYTLYNEVALSVQSLVPDRCKLPTKEDWKIIVDYFGNDASYIKSGVWTVLTQNVPIQSANNTSFMNCLPTIVYFGSNKTKEDSSVLYATIKQDGSLDKENTILLRSDNNLINNNISNPETTRAMYSVRCLFTW